jgi:aminoglycoside phosphotransferase (APT) family kinase protein
MASHEDTLRALLEAHGLAAERFERIATGKFNDSYFVSLADGGQVVLRIAPPDDAGFLFYERGMMAQEPGLHRLIRERTSLPVAEILAHDTSRDIIDRDFLVMQRLPGRALSEVSLPGLAVDRAMEHTGRLLREVHDTCRDGRYGYLGEHRPMEPAESWAEALRTMWGLLIDDIRACGAYDADEAKAVTEALSPHLRLFDREVPSCLLHMDIWAQNILVDESGNVTGLVDWDRALWGDVEIEFAVLDYCGISTAAFWRGYGRERDTSPEARVRWAFYYLYELQKYIVIRIVRSKRPRDAARYKDHALRMLAEF